MTDRAGNRVDRGDQLREWVQKIRQVLTRAAKIFIVECRYPRLWERLRGFFAAAGSPLSGKPKWSETPVPVFAGAGVIHAESVGAGGLQTSGEASPSGDDQSSRRGLRILTNKGWKAGYCPYFLHDNQVRVTVRSWISLAEIDDAFVVPGRRIRTVLAYIRMYGLVPTITKIISRLSESDRNAKCIALGWGVVAETCAESPLSVGQPVVFLAPFHPLGVNEVCLHYGLARPLKEVPESLNSSDCVFFGNRSDGGDHEVDRLAGWTQWSGAPLDDALVASLLDRYEPLLFDSDVTSGLRKLQAESDDAPTQPRRRQHGGDTAGSTKKRAVVFGLGQYAKVGVIPRVRRYMDVACLHELDPVQLGPVEKHTCDVRTSMHPEPDEQYDVYLISSFHHTHAPLAIAGLKQGATVVVEKPLVTTAEQLDSLLDTLKTTAGTFFAGYQRRYGPLNQYLRDDLLIGSDTPVSIRAIVFEIPTPQRHWYRWPNSGSRIISNACHWIDHFLFLNNFVPPTKIDATGQSNGDVLVAIDLENGASFCLSITEWGSSRLGMRDVVHFTAGQRAATVTDSTHYVAESSAQVLRRARAKRIVGFDDMYHTIGRKIATDQPGDTLQSIEVSTRAVLAAEEAFQRSVSG